MPEGRWPRGATPRPRSSNPPHKTRPDSPVLTLYVGLGGKCRERRKRPPRLLAEGEPCPFPQGLFSGQWGGQECTREGALAGRLCPTPLLLGASLPHKWKNLGPQPAAPRGIGESQRLQGEGSVPGQGAALPVSGSHRVCPHFPGTLGGQRCRWRWVE